MARPMMLVNVKRWEFSDLLYSHIIILHASLPQYALQTPLLISPP